MDRAEKSAEKCRTEKTGKKRYLLAVVLAAVLFITPLVVYAALYSSNERENEFKPGAVDIEIYEKKGPDEEEYNNEKLKMGFQWSSNGSDGYKAEKIVRINDTRKYAGEELRVCFVPMWTDADGNVCNVFDFKNVAFDSTANTIIYADPPGENAKTITLVLYDNWENEGWVYDVSDGYFYYEGELRSGKMTPFLLKEVKLNTAACALADAGYDLQLDVLADAIQRSGDAKHERGWMTPSPTPTPEP